MEDEQNGTRIDAMMRAIREITSVYELANPQGIRSINFINTTKRFRNIRTGTLYQPFKSLIYNGITRTGTALRIKVLDTFVWKSPMSKPLLVIIITDGEVGF